jgi:hypothetical protein
VRDPDGQVVQVISPSTRPCGPAQGGRSRHVGAASSAPMPGLIALRRGPVVQMRGPNLSPPGAAAPCAAGSGDGAVSLSSSPSRANPIHVAAAPSPELTALRRFTGQYGKQDTTPRRSAGARVADTLRRPHTAGPWSPGCQHPRPSGSLPCRQHGRPAGRPYGGAG